MSTGTRSTTKLEEQMVAWMARIEQGQQNMQAGLSGQIKDLSQQFAQQAERLDGVVSKQEETERQITSLQGDLYAVKDLVDSRLRTTEEAVTGLATAQNALRERQMSLREELREELQSELREKLSAAAATAGDPGSTLSPMARPFVPGSEPEEGRAAYGHVQRAAPYDGTSPWASPTVLVPKKDGGVRFCVDFRKLNQVAKFDAYPMPRIEEMFESIGSATIVTTLDLASGYWPRTLGMRITRSLSCWQG